MSTPARFTVSTTVSLTPTEALVASQLSYWVQKALDGLGGKEDSDGKRWSWLSASDLRQRLLRRFYTDLTEHSLYRVLRSLVSKGWFVRAQLLYSTHRNSTYFYRFGPAHPSATAPTVTSDCPEVKTPAFTGSHPGVSLLNTPSISSKVLTKSLSKGPSKGAAAAEATTAVVTSSPEPKAQQPATLDTGRSITEPQKAPEDTATPQMLGSIARPVETPLVSSESPLANPSHLSSQARSVWERVQALAASFDPSKVEAVSPRGVVSGGKLLRVNDGLCSPLR